MGRARAEDGEAFPSSSALVGELLVRCLLSLGSAQDAEDAVQKTLLTTQRGLASLEGRVSVRASLPCVATSQCVDALRSVGSRPRDEATMPGFEHPEPTRLGDVVWLEPYPDVLLEGLQDGAPGPDARHDARESISLAFVAALQRLPPEQRVALVLRDVLGFRTSEVASILDTSEQSVTRALKRARATLKRERPLAANQEPPPPRGSAIEQDLVARLTQAYAAGDVHGVVALLTDDVRLSMPPLPLEYRGLELAARFHATVTFRQGRTIRLITTGANGQPAFGMYVRDSATGRMHANGLLVLTLSGTRISELTRFDNSLMPRFGLPRTLSG
jgi:RNA polymerase sigma-70 factor (ECF subfamily)